MIVFNQTALNALRAVLMLSLLGCSSGMYLFVKRRVGVIGGLIAGLVYVYSPYLMFTEAYARGTYPELLAFALFPFILWRIAVLRDKSSAFNFITVVVLQVALIHAHNLMALTLTGLSMAWILWETLIPLTNRRSGQAYWQASILAMLAILLGMGVSAGFWVPVLLESGSVNLQNLTGVSLLDYRNFFVPFGDLLAFPPQHDAGAINGLKELTILGVAQWILALVGLLIPSWLYIRGVRSRHPQTYLGLFFFTLMAVIMIFLVTPSAGLLWDSVRPLQFLQFPWRLLGPVAVCLAVLAGMNGIWITRLSKQLQIGVIAILVAMPIVTAIPLFYIPEWTNTEIDTSLSAYHASEKAGLQMGTTFTDEYRPADVFSIPAPTDSLIADYADDYPVDKLNRSILPETTIVELIDNTPQSHQWRITSDEPFTAEIYNFYWIGWQAELNGEPLVIIPSPNHGFITMTIPEGEHDLRVFLGSTPARDMGMGISLVSLVLVLMLVVGIRRFTIKTHDAQVDMALARNAIIGILFGGVIAVLSVFVLYREGVAWLNSPAGRAIPATIDETFTLDDNLEVLGYDINGRTFRAGDRLIVRVYWYANQVMDINFSSFLHVSTGGPPVAQIDKLHPGGRAISEWWSPDGYIIDTYDLYLPDTIPVGDYQLYVGLYTCELMPVGECGNGYRPTVLNANSEQVGDTVPFGTIEVR